MSVNQFGGLTLMSYFYAEQPPPVPSLIVGRTAAQPADADHGDSGGHDVHHLQQHLGFHFAIPATWWRLRHDGNRRRVG